MDDPNVVHLPFYGKRRFCHDWDGITMGPCLESDDDDYEDGAMGSKDGVDSYMIPDAKYEGVGGRKICVERAEGLDYF